MPTLTHEERIISRCRDIYSGRNITPEWAAESCGISTAEFEDFYNQYINRLCYTIQRKSEWFIVKEWEFLILSGYMRPDIVAERFLGDKSPESIEKIQRWIESNGGINKNLSWRDMRLIQVKQKEQEKVDGEN